MGYYDYIIGDFIMILFLEDWRRYPKAIVDTNTKNRSFVELADKYRQMGLKNYFFLLALHNPALQGVDPYDPNLTEAQMAQIIVECEANPWYFFREVFRLPSQGSSVPDPLIANRGNIGTYWLYFNHIDVGLTQPRQTGKSVGADGLNTYIIQVAGKRATFTLITKDHSLRTKNIQRLKDMRDLLPPYLNHYLPKIDKNNPFEITVTELGNEVRTGVAQASEALALNLGRGNTSENNHNDEGPFCKNIHITVPAFLSSGNAARANAAKAGSFYGNIFTTTAGKLDTVEGAYMYKLFKGGMPFNEKVLFDVANEKQLRAVVETQSTHKPLVYICLSHRQLGYTDEWLYKSMLDSNSVGDEADRDYMNRWTFGSLKSPLSQQINDAIKASIESPQHIEISGRNYLINWYIPENKIHEVMSSGKFIIGNDTAEGLGDNRDSITLYCADVTTYKTIFTVSIKESNVYSFIQWMCKEIVLKYPNTLIIPERKSVGVVLIDMLVVTLISMNINPFQRVYNTVVDDGLHNTNEEFHFVHRPVETWPSYVADKYKSKFGYGTAGSGRHSRNNLFVETLSRAADLCARNIKDSELIDQITKLVVKGSRIDHAASGHDDLCVAWLLSMWCLLHSKNLDFYGLSNVGGLACGITETIQKETAPKGWAKVQHTANQETQERIKALLTEIEESDDDNLVDMLESRIRVLSRRVVSEDFTATNVDSMVRKAREARNNSYYG